MDKEHYRELGINFRGETVIKTSTAKIILRPHLPLVPNRLNEEELERLLSFCQQESKGYRLDSSPQHKRATSAIKEAARRIYQSFFLISNEEKGKISAFSEVKLRDETNADCIIVGPCGIILVEVKHPGGSVTGQLEHYRTLIRGEFPIIPILTARAIYRGNKITIKTTN